jgi:hypothetical protein
LKDYLQYRNVADMRNVLFEVSHCARPARIIVNFPMAKKANGETVLEIIQSLPISASEMMSLSGDRAADLTLDMFSQER